MKQLIMSQTEIKEVTEKLGKQFTELFKNEELPPIFIGVLKGALPFMIDLIRNVDCPIQTDFIQVSSYLGTESTGIIKLKKDISMPIEGRTVVIVEDIVDTGNTLKWLTEYFNENYFPKKIITCSLLDKPCKRQVDVKVDYIGKEIGNCFIVGYGLDYNEFLRNEKEVYVPAEEEIKYLDELTDRL